MRDQYKRMNIKLHADVMIPWRRLGFRNVCLHNQLRNFTQSNTFRNDWPGVQATRWQREEREIIWTSARKIPSSFNISTVQLCTVMENSTKTSLCLH